MRARLTLSIEAIEVNIYNLKVKEEIRFVNGEE